ncbi:MAG: hypothetical protein WDZ50_05080 [Woeseia sp.]
MNLLAIIIIFLAVITAGSIAYIAWELSSGRPVFKNRESDAPDAGDNPSASDNAPGTDRHEPD